MISQKFHRERMIFTHFWMVFSVFSRAEFHFTCKNWEFFTGVKLGFTQKKKHWSLHTINIVIPRVPKNMAVIWSQSVYKEKGQKISTFFYGIRKQVRAPGAPGGGHRFMGPRVLLGPLGSLFFCGALRALGLSGALDPAPWRTNALFQIKDRGSLEVHF